MHLTMCLYDVSFKDVPLMNASTDEFKMNASNDVPVTMHLIFVCKMKRPGYTDCMKRCV
jgi:hypothetical protein